MLRLRWKGSNSASTLFVTLSLILGILFLWTASRSITRVEQQQQQQQDGCSPLRPLQLRQSVVQQRPNPPSTSNKQHSYQPASVEAWILSHLEQLGWNRTDPLPSGCDIWKEAPTTTSSSSTTTTITTPTTTTTTTIHKELQFYLKSLDAYHKAVEQFPGVKQDLRTTMIQTILSKQKEEEEDQDYFLGENSKESQSSSSSSSSRIDWLTNSEKRSICQQVQLHPDGILHGFFSSGRKSTSSSGSNTSPQQQQQQQQQQLLSFSNHSAFGYIEPLVTPMRNPHFCTDEQTKDHHNSNNMFSLNYMVHDFEHICYHQLQPHSKTILIDMGASLKFYGAVVADNSRTPPPPQPMVDLIRLYEKFGITFDHIYGFEIKKISPKEAYQLIPSEFMASYHWINIGVSSQKGHKKNPFDSIVRKFQPDDLVIVKLDIDTNYMELALAQQLLEDDTLNRLVDHFYFEQHVHMKEIAFAWTESMAGTLADTFQLFHGLRQKGVAAHFWP